MAWIETPRPGPAGARAGSADRGRVWNYVFWLGLIFSVCLHLMVVLVFVFDLPFLIRSWLALAGINLPEATEVIEPPEVVRVSLWGETPRMTSPAPLPEPASTSGASGEPAPESLSPPETTVPPDVIPLGDKAEEEAKKTEVKKMKTAPPKVAPPQREAPAAPSPAPRPQNSRNPQSPNVYDMMRRTLGRDARAMAMGSPRGQRVDLAASQYYNRVAHLISSKWVTPARNMRGDLIVTYSITIEPDGRISRVKKLNPSGDADFDRRVELAIKASSPLPPLPPSFGGRRDEPVFSFTPSILGGKRR